MFGSISPTGFAMPMEVPGLGVGQKAPTAPAAQPEAAAPAAEAKPKGHSFLDTFSKAGASFLEQISAFAAQFKSDRLSTSASRGVEDMMHSGAKKSAADIGKAALGSA